MHSSDEVKDPAILPPAVINWLFGVIQPIYQDGRATFHDSVALLSQFKQFRPRTRVFTNVNGVSELLLCIYGTIESAFPVPLLLWLPKSYPLEHPLIFIDLESLEDFRLSVGPYVNPNGEVSIPLFDKWDPQLNNILQVIQEINLVCQLNNLVQPTGMKLRNEPPLPENPLAIPPELPTKPPKPPKPFRNPSSLHNSNLMHDDVSTIPLQHTGEGLARSPPIPPKPPKSLQLSVVDLLDSEISTAIEPAHQNALVLLQKSINQLTQEDVQYLHENVQNRNLTLLSAVEQFERMYDYESATLKNISEVISRSKSSLETQIALVKERAKEVDDYEKFRGGKPDPSSLVASENVAINQLYELVGRDCAISDTIHALSRLLSCNSIKLDLFAKKTRELAREQFVTRTHIKKVTQLLESGRC